MKPADSPDPQRKLDYLGDEWSGNGDLRDFQVRLDERVSLFFSLCIVLYAMVFMWVVFSLYLVKPRLEQFSPVLFRTMGVGALVGLAIFGLDFLHLGISAIAGRKIIFSRSASIIPTQVLVPVIVMLGGLLGISRDRISSSFVKFNNALVRVRETEHPMLPQELLVLLPRCIQHFECPQVVTEDIRNCKRCGKCMIKDVVDLVDEFGCRTYMVTGGSAARKAVRKIKPRAIIAVACERELLSGIQDVHHVSILGVANRRPEGPCKNTDFSLDELKTCIRNFVRHSPTIDNTVSKER